MSRANWRSNLCLIRVPQKPAWKKTKTRIYKPDSVFGLRQTPTIYLGLRSHANSSLPTPQHWASRPYLATEAAARWCTWHCNPQGLSAPIVAYQRRALLPHIFTLTNPTMPLKRKYEPTFYPFFRKANKQIAMRLLKPKCANLYVTLPFGEGRGGAAVIFCDTCCLSFRKSHPLGGAVLCVVRTFLVLHTAARDRTMRVLTPQR